MPERPVLEAVVFDVGGTLVRLDYEWMSGVVAALGHPLGPEALRRAEVAGRRAFDASLGRPPDRPLPAWVTSRFAGESLPYFATMLEAAAVPERLHDAALERWYARAAEGRLWGRPAEGAREALAGLGALGLRLACVSNSDGRAERHLVECGVRDGLEFVVDSQIEGVEKPDPRIFDVALRRLGMPAARALYVGDLRCADERGARAAGMHFVLLDPFGDYAGADTPAVDAIARLTAWIPEHFAIPAGRGAPPPA